ncbi:hypothetical protein SLE2022_329950 [Rubroshorea leprosula]
MLLALNFTDCCMFFPYPTKLKGPSSYLPTMGTVCLICGDRGISKALVYCHKCQIYAVHCYCMHKVTFEEDVVWFCVDCLTEVSEPHILQHSLPAKGCDAENSEIVQVTLPRSKLKKQTPSSISKRRKISYQQISVAPSTILPEQAMLGILQQSDGSEIREDAIEATMVEKQSMHATHCLQNQILPEELVHADEDCQTSDLQEPSGHLQPREIMCQGSQGDGRTDSIFPFQNQSTETFMNIMSAAGDELVNPYENDSAEKQVHASKDYRAVGVECAPSSALATPLFLQEPTDVLQPQESMVNGSQECRRTDRLHQFGNQSTGKGMNGTTATGDEIVNPNETDSADNSVCYVGPYIVNMDVAPIVQSIMDKHPDIAQDCPLSVQVRSLLLQGLGMELKKLMSFTSENLLSEHLKSLDYAIGDAECAQLNVNWLRDWHDQLTRTVDLLELLRKIKRALAKGNEPSMSTKTTSNLDRAALMNIKNDIQLLKREAALLEVEIEDQEGSTRDFALKCLSKIKRFCGKTLANGIL